MTVATIAEACAKKNDGRIIIIHLERIARGGRRLSRTARDLLCGATF